MTAVWNVYSVMTWAVLFENFARMSITPSPICRLDTSNTMWTSLSDTTSVLVDGKEVSSGSAELKLQSSSIEVPLVVASFREGAGVKSKIEAV